MFENHRSPVVGRTAIRALNGPLADHLRALGLPRGGVVWEQAKALAVAGLPVTREALGFEATAAPVEVAAPAWTTVWVSEPEAEPVDLTAFDVPFTPVAQPVVEAPVTVPTARTAQRVNRYGRPIAAPGGVGTGHPQRNHVAKAKAPKRVRPVVQPVVKAQLPQLPPFEFAPTERISTRVPRERRANEVPVAEQAEPRSWDEQLAQLEQRLARMPRKNADLEALLDSVLGHRPGKWAIGAAKKARTERRALTLHELLDADAFDAEASERFAWS